MLRNRPSDRRIVASGLFRNTSRGPSRPPSQTSANMGHDTSAASRRYLFQGFIELHHRSHCEVAAGAGYKLGHRPRSTSNHEPIHTVLVHENKRSVREWLERRYRCGLHKIVASVSSHVNHDDRSLVHALPVSRKIRGAKRRCERVHCLVGLVVVTRYPVKEYEHCRQSIRRHHLEERANTVQEQTETSLAVFTECTSSVTGESHRRHLLDSLMIQRHGAPIDTTRADSHTTTGRSRSSASRPSTSSISTNSRYISSTSDSLRSTEARRSRRLVPRLAND